MHRLIVFFTAVISALLLTALPAAAADDAFPGIRKLMTVEEFQSMGLDQLTPEQLDALDDWLLRYTAVEAPILADKKEVRKAEKEHEVVSRIVGNFTGWTGNTIFELDNGQRWRQRLEDRYRYDGPPNPKVRIDRNFFGFYELELVDEGRRIGVTRIP